MLYFVLVIFSIKDWCYSYYLHAFSVRKVSVSTFWSDDRNSNQIVAYV